MSRDGCPPRGSAEDGRQGALDAAQAEVGLAAGEHERRAHADGAVAGGEAEDVAVVESGERPVPGVGVRQVEGEEEAAAASVGDLAREEALELDDAFEEVGSDLGDVRRAGESSSMTSMIRWLRTMSTRLPPQVELMRDEILNTESTSSTRGPAARPQIWVFLANEKMSGSTPKCSNDHHFPVVPKPVWTSSKISRNSCSSASSRSLFRNSARKWLSPPSPWIGSTMSAAMSCPCFATAVSISVTAWRSSAIVVSSPSGVNGKRSIGLTTRGQGNLGKYWVLRGSAVLVSESV